MPQLIRAIRTQQRPQPYSESNNFYRFTVQNGDKRASFVLPLGSGYLSVPDDVDFVIQHLRDFALDADYEYDMEDLIAMLDGDEQEARELVAFGEQCRDALGRLGLEEEED